MAGDIEEFLRRAAERRQQRANQRNAQQQQATRPAAPQYTDRATERLPRAERRAQQAPPYQPPVQQAEPLLAEIIEDDEHESMSQRRRSREAEDQAKVDSELQRHSEEGKQERSDRGEQSNAAEDIIRLLKSPNGMKQAVILREILEPRSNFWD
ncbi:hypothetical protein [Roseimaritima ulvae]|uniref:Uncharacterized protein n=1 Tax=Roseimaritima ulvae TaxID=980254 RepID=A0A5B9R5X1_9BACT|nr:hypothetical protein [Roseimaritima ulvae]QEG41643.1 hypothetical protein UC8_36690 [Roseimaritima ulvae]